MTTSDSYPGTATETGAEQQPDTLAADFIRDCFARANTIRDQRLLGIRFLDTVANPLLRAFAANVASSPTEVVRPDGFATLDEHSVEYTQRTMFGGTQVLTRTEYEQKKYWLLRRAIDYSGRPLCFNYYKSSNGYRTSLEYSFEYVPACIIVTDDGALYKIPYFEGDLEEQMAIEAERLQNAPQAVSFSIDLCSPEDAANPAKQRAMLASFSSDIHTVIQRAVIPA